MSFLHSIRLVVLLEFLKKAGLQPSDGEGVMLCIVFPYLTADSHFI